MSGLGLSHSPSSDNVFEHVFAVAEGFLYEDVRSVRLAEVNLQQAYDTLDTFQMDEQVDFRTQTLNPGMIFCNFLAWL